MVKTVEDLAQAIRDQAEPGQWKQLQFPQAIILHSLKDLAALSLAMDPVRSPSEHLESFNAIGWTTCPNAQGIADRIDPEVMKPVIEK